jgi:hypothetical protein
MRFYRGSTCHTTITNPLPEAKDQEILPLFGSDVAKLVPVPGAIVIFLSCPLESFHVRVIAQAALVPFWDAKAVFLLQLGPGVDPGGITVNAAGQRGEAAITPSSQMNPRQICPVTNGYKVSWAEIRSHFTARR